MGAILTQNTAWTNVEKALRNLRAANAISVEAVRQIPLEELEKLVQPAGFFRQKTARLKRFVAWLDERYEGSLDRMFAQPTSKLRDELLGLSGIGPETADSILLYAGQHEIFVVDAYARRILERHGVVKPEAKYDEIRELIEGSLRCRHEQISANGLPRDSENLEPGPGPAAETLLPTVHPPTKMSENARTSLAQDYNEFHALIVQMGKHYCLSRVARCEKCPLRVYLDSQIVVSKSKGKGKRTKQKL